MTCSEVYFLCTKVATLRTLLALLAAAAACVAGHSSSSSSSSSSSGISTVNEPSTCPILHIGVIVDPVTTKSHPLLIEKAYLSCTARHERGTSGGHGTGRGADGDGVAYLYFIGQALDDNNVRFIASYGRAPLVVSRFMLAYEVPAALLDTCLVRRRSNATRDNPWPELEWRVHVHIVDCFVAKENAFRDSMNDEMNSSENEKVVERQFLHSNTLLSVELVHARSEASAVATSGTRETLQRTCERERAAAARHDTRDFLAVCSVLRNEADNVAEWIAWHAYAGVQRFYLFDDHSADDTAASARLAAPQLVRTDAWRGDGHWRQLSALNACLLKYGARAEWMLVIDVDEYVQVRSSGGGGGGGFAHGDERSALRTWLTKHAVATNVSGFFIPWLQFTCDAAEETHGDALRVARCRRRAAHAFLGNVELASAACWRGTDAQPEFIAGKSLFRVRHVTGMHLSHTPVYREASTAPQWLRAQPLDVAANDNSSSSSSSLFIRHLALPSRATFSMNQAHSNLWSHSVAWKRAHFNALQCTYNTTSDTVKQKTLTAIRRQLASNAAAAATDSS